MIHPIKVPFVNLGLQYQNMRAEILEKFDQISSRGSHILSNDVCEFEENFAKCCDVKHAVSVGNGSDALVLSLHALGIAGGDEVITAPNSFIASAWAIVRVGAVPVFADVREDYNLDPEEVLKAITPRTKAIIPVHLTGRPAPMDDIQSIARDKNLVVIEDAAQAIGASYKGRKVGSLGHAGCFSLHPLKNLHVHGDGGVITTNDTALNTKLKLLRNHGLKNRDECVLWGFNSRLDGIQAAIGNLKLPHLEDWTDRVRSIAKTYGERLHSIMTVPTEQPYENSVYHRYVVRSEDRDTLQRYLLNKGIETKINYPIPIHLQEVCNRLGYQVGDFPMTELLARQILSLPMYAELEDWQVEYVIEAIEEFHREGRQGRD